MGNTVRPIEFNLPLVNDEFRRLFALYNRANNSSLVHQPPAKRGRGNSWGPTRSFKPQDTWTHYFFVWHK